MTRPRLYKTEAIVIRGINLGEADRLLSLYTPNLGKLKAVARGVRRPGSKLGGHVELLTHSQMMLAQGKSLDIITQSQTLHSFMPLKSDLERLSQALYVADLVDGFTAERQESYALFRLLLNILDWLCQSGNGEVALRYFEVQMLGHLGYRPRLGECATCGLPLATPSHFSPSAGGAICPQCCQNEPLAHALSPAALKALAFFQTCAPTQARRVRLAPELSLELKRVLHNYIRYLLEREVKSATWLERLRRERKTGYGEGATNEGGRLVTGVQRGRAPLTGDSGVSPEPISPSPLKGEGAGGEVAEGATNADLPRTASSAMITEGNFPYDGS